MRSACILSPSCAVFWLLALAPAAFGCASEGDALEKRFAKLQEDVTRIQSENDRMAERLDAVELRQATAPRAEEKVASAETTTLTRPKLKIVHLEADGEAASDEGFDATADDGGPRVVIQGEGKTLESRSVAGTAKPAPKAEPKTEPQKKSDAAKAVPK